MYQIYIDSGTSNSKLYLVKDTQSVDTIIANVGTKDSAISGSNDVLLSGLKEIYNHVLDKNGLKDCDIESIWLSGMVTNPFGIIEVAHISTPVDGKKLLEHRYVHFEEKYFHRYLNLIPGVKTAQPGQIVTMENIDKMNNVRGEEIEAIGMVASGVIPREEDCVMISPGSHTHLLYIKNGTITDIVSNFTGELNYAIKKDTILGGELTNEDIVLTKEYVIQGYNMVKTYGLARALYIIHATKVFDVCENEIRNCLLSGVIAGGVMDMLKYKLDRDWNGVKKVVIIGGKNYIEGYKIVGQYILPEVDMDVVSSKAGESYGLYGYLELARILKMQG
ncbi:2-dehydro-3-deoxygalactonokinase [Anaerotignum sp. MB30-C6]|uniref:2-dehydro-3-deoxygalactonokinase n=1 Tax=Anaerotignum sp. MB30-C6 TaxID=3070814 RepID=UPI0027DB495E|nr:2-dehydro-3-deoxygalactonokinase [Anaerotignum sp. MB30-C6]WMI80259.1 2-dehydro-3-deoxygalactonokinase [Anaerotignum sp. MB30-C6]